MFDKVILLTNDDGILAEGLKAMIDVLNSFDLWVVAPREQKSGASHSITIDKPIKVEKIGEKIFVVDGTPTDCVNIAVNGLMPRKPDLVVSGINNGANIGDDILYSGTFAAAMEGALLGIPSLALSMKLGGERRYDKSAIFSLKIIKYILEMGLPDRVVINVNFPDNPSGKFRITKLSRRIYGTPARSVEEGKIRFWYLGDLPHAVKKDDFISDFEALEKGFISITPVKIEFREYFLDWLYDINLE